MSKPISEYGVALVPAKLLPVHTHFSFRAVSMIDRKMVSVSGRIINANNGKVGFQFFDGTLLLPGGIGYEQFLNSPLVCVIPAIQMN